MTSGFLVNFGDSDPFENPLPGSTETRTPMAEQDRRSPHLSERRNARIIGAGLALATFSLYLPVLSAQFLQYDDGIYVLDNPLLRNLSADGILSLLTSGYFRSYTPMALLSHGLDLAVWGVNPFGHHLTSVAFHCANTLLTFLLFVQLRHNAGLCDEHRSAGWTPILGGALVILLFAWHPLRVETVAWISDRKDLLMTFFLLLSFRYYVAFRSAQATSGARKFYRLSLILFACGVLSKSTAVSYPLVLLLLEATVYRTREAKHMNVREVLPFAVVALLGAAAAFLAGTGYRNPESITRLTGLQQLSLPFYSLGFYAWKTIAPFPLTPFYTPAPAPQYFVLAVAGLFLVALCFLLFLRGRQGLPLAVGSAFCLLLPTIVGALATSGIQPWADRYTYIASVGVFLLASLWLSKWLTGVSGPVPRPRMLFAGLAGIVALTPAAYLSTQQMEVWRNSMSLWSHVVRTSPAVPKGYNNMGALLAGQGAISESIPFYRQALALNPTYADAWNNLGLAFGALGMIDSAAVAHENAIDADSNYIDAYTSYGNLLLEAGRCEDAILLYRRALERDPASAKAWYNLGIASYKKGDSGSALASLRRAAEVDPSSPRTFLSLGVVLSDMDSLLSAEEAFRAAARRGSREAQQLLRERGIGW